VITHYGRHENGHYICYRQSPYDIKNDDELDDDTQKKTRPWWRLSDEEVKEVSEDVVLAQGGVFMLFYEQVPLSLPPPPVFLKQGFEDTSIMKSTEQDDEAVKSISAKESDPTSKEPESADKDQPKVALPSAYPTPPPEPPYSSLGKSTGTPTNQSPNPIQASPTFNKSHLSLSSTPSAVAKSSPSSINGPPTSPSDTTSPARPEFQRLQTPPAEPIPIIPMPTSPLSPRTGMGRDRRSNVGLESMGGTVQAN
jgi:hypothetical protein